MYHAACWSLLKSWAKSQFKISPRLDQKNINGSRSSSVPLLWLHSERIHQNVSLQESLGVPCMRWRVHSARLHITPTRPLMHMIHAFQLCVFGTKTSVLTSIFWTFKHVLFSVWNSQFNRLGRTRNFQRVAAIPAHREWSLKYKSKIKIGWKYFPPAQTN